MCGVPRAKFAYWGLIPGPADMHVFLTNVIAKQRHHAESPDFLMCANIVVHVDSGRHIFQSWFQSHRLISKSSKNNKGQLVMHSIDMFDDVHAQFHTKRFRNIENRMFGLVMPYCPAFPLKSLIPLRMMINV